MFMVIRRAFHGHTDSPSFIRRWIVSVQVLSGLKMRSEVVQILILPYAAWFISILATACVGYFLVDAVTEIDARYLDRCGEPEQRLKESSFLLLFRQVGSLVSSL